MENFDPEFNISAADVRKQAEYDIGYAYPKQSREFKREGMNPLSAARASFGPNRGQGAPAAPQAKSPHSKDATWYANSVGDYGAAQAILGSKNGGAIFQLFDEFDFDMGPDKEPTKMRIVPKGEREVMTPRGPQKVPLWQHAYNSGVKTVPFKSGDDAAEMFRTLMGDGQSLLKNLSRLEKLYTQNMVLSGLGPSQDAAEARGLESRILMDFSRLMSGAKGLGGQVSDRDLTVFQSMTPQRASAWFTRLKGNEMQLLRQVRQQALHKLKSVAQANGVDLLPEESGSKQVNVEKYDSLSRELE